MVPHLVTALNGPLLDLEKRMLDKTTEIERWFRLAWAESTPPFYSSVDVRNAGFKLAPVDTNLFPGGFNNLAPEMMPLAIQAAMSAVEKICPDAKSMVLIPERHTRNTFYLTNVARLASILKQTGLNVRLGSVSDEITEPTRFELPDGQSLLLEPLVRRGNRVGVEGLDPCAVLLNNDLSAGVPPILQNLDGQVLLPPLHAGWATRRKSAHFAAYNRVVDSFAQMLEIDPWLINPYFAHRNQLNFHERVGEEDLAAAVDEVLGKTREKYAQYGISEQPYVVVKADAGTYGMGIMTVKDASEVVGLNRKQRNKMSVVKEGLQVSDVIIQEGVHTFESIDDAVAEPVVYMIDRYVVGGFYRVHTGRGRDENLNAPGMHFVPLAFESPCNTPDCSDRPDAAVNRFYAYGVIARLAALAASHELETVPNVELAA
ncbi:MULTISPECIES: glutamate--cysteine ligase [Limnobacter]|uniref:Glutamate--cysteine ligase n=1 Tax=Limnobacter litoralis TaxID=481366 RepID=A0ABQ5YQC4_9BURK|nr:MULTISPECIES: glutamate--cysteine ligase [Limnobacter]GLR25436.1 glutamate--cysteine ligase [Limnobacter litoralis]HEX5484833.1 glutamate--cysteine ligase [Limnobacter sp.]